MNRLPHHRPDWESTLNPTRTRVGSSKDRCAVCEHRGEHDGRKEYGHYLLSVHISMIGLRRLISVGVLCISSTVSNVAIDQLQPKIEKFDRTFQTTPFFIVCMALILTKALDTRLQYSMYGNTRPVDCTNAVPLWNAHIQAGGNPCWSDRRRLRTNAHPPRHPNARLISGSAPNYQILILTQKLLEPRTAYVQSEG